MNAALELAWPDPGPDYEWYRESQIAALEEPPAVIPARTITAAARPVRLPRVAGSMTRDELEAVIWRHLTSPAAVDAILSAADQYATTEAVHALRMTGELGAAS